DAPSIVIGVKPTAKGSLTNQAGVTTDALETGIDAHSNTVSDPVTIRTVDLEIQIKDSVNNQANLGSSFYYTITVINHGQVASGNVVVMDTLSNANAQLGALPPGCTSTGPLTFTCTIGPIATGATATQIIIPATAATLGSVTHTAIIQA